MSHPIDLKMLDDWKGVIDPKTRRTLQNRLNQRAHRRRLKASKSTDNPTPLEESHETTLTVQNKNYIKPKGTNTLQITLKDLDKLCVFGPHAEKSRLTLHHLETLLHAEFLAGSPRTDLLFSLKRVNFLRALHANIDILGYSAAEMHDDALSQFGAAGPAKPTLRDSALLPAALQPSSIQRAVPHHPWLDLLPIVQMRDNLILAGESYDDEQLCRDLGGHGTQVQSQVLASSGKRAGDARGETGVIIWRDPWDPEGWEVTESFLQRWGWAVRGCWGLFRATNRWRAVRGEPPLFRIRSDCVDS